MCQIGSNWDVERVVLAMCVMCGGMFNVAWSEKDRLLPNAKFSFKETKCLSYSSLSLSCPLSLTLSLTLSLPFSLLSFMFPSLYLLHDLFLFLQV